MRCAADDFEAEATEHRDDLHGFSDGFDAVVEAGQDVCVQVDEAHAGQNDTSAKGSPMVTDNPVRFSLDGRKTGKGNRMPDEGAADLPRRQAEERAQREAEARVWREAEATRRRDEKRRRREAGERERQRREELLRQIRTEARIEGSSIVEPFQH